MTVLFDYMAAHTEAGESGSDDLVKLCTECEAELRTTVEAKFFRIMRLNFKQVGEVIGMHGANVAKIRKDGTSVELYHHNTFLITAHSESAVADGVSMITKTINAEHRKAGSSDIKATVPQARK